MNSNGCAAYLISTENSVDPDLLVQAALRAAYSLGVEICGQTEVQEISSTSGQVEVVAGASRFRSRVAVNCQGAWAGQPVRPRKGQMIYLQPQHPALLQHVVRTPEVYLVPRSSGKILAGATVEDVGYDRNVSPAVVQQLHRAAAEFVPQLESAPVIASWAGLRPGTPDDLPLLGKTETPGLLMAAGHFRNGILLAPITARIMADLIGNKTPAEDLSAFSPSRFSAVTA